jgi:integrase
MIPPAPTPSSQPPIRSRLRRKPPTVRQHAGNGTWTICIGKQLIRDGSRLVPKNWYYGGTEDAANAEAARQADKWAFVVRNWSTLYQPTLSVIGSPFADAPHWPATLGAKNAPTDKEVADFQVQPPAPEEIAEAYEGVTLGGVFSLFKLEIARKVRDGDARQSTARTMEKNVRCGLKFFREATRMDAFGKRDIESAKGAMLADVDRRDGSRRTVDNYLSAIRGMLTWFYDGSDYGSGLEKPRDFDNAFFVKNAKKSNVKIPTAADAKVILSHATGHARLMTLLALNCGMYAADIGRLTLDEVNLDEGYIFWDREKQPDNEFRVRHDLWPETLEIVRRMIQRPGTPRRHAEDYRGAKPYQLDCSTLAFVDGQGGPLYKIRKTGKAYDKLAKAWQSTMSTITAMGLPTQQFHSLRKVSSQMLTDLLQSLVDGDDRGQLIAVKEVKDMFLGHRSDHQPF